MIGPIDCYKTAWRRLWPHFVTILVTGIITVILTAPATTFGNWAEETDGFLRGLYFSLGAFAAWLLLSGPIEYGFDYVCLRAARDEDVAVEDVFQGFRRYLDAVLAHLCVGLIVGVGIIFLIVPGIILACRLSMTSYLVLDEGMSAVDALQESWDMTRGHGWTVFFIGVPRDPDRHPGPGRPRHRCRGVGHADRNGVCRVVREARRGSQGRPRLCAERLIDVAVAEAHQVEHGCPGRNSRSRGSRTLLYDRLGVVGHPQAGMASTSAGRWRRRRWRWSAVARYLRVVAISLKQRRLCALHRRCSPSHLPGHDTVSHTSSRIGDTHSRCRERFLQTAHRHTETPRRGWRSCNQSASSDAHQPVCPMGSAATDLCYRMASTGLGQALREGPPGRRKLSWKLIRSRAWRARR